MKNLASLLCVAVLMFSVFMTSGCASSGGERLVIGVSLPTQREERWVRDAKKMKEEAKRLGVDFRLQISDNDAGRQASQVENLISQGVDVLIIAPHDAKGAATLVEKAHEAGIKVICYDRLIMDSDPDLYISFDNVEVGRIQGRAFVNAVPSGNIVVLAGAPTDNNAHLFRQGAMEILQPLISQGKYTVVMDQFVKDWEPSEAMNLMENALTANANNIAGVLAPNDGTAGGVIQALSAQELSGKVPVTGQDAELQAVKRIIEGSQMMTVFKDTGALGTAAIEAAIKMASEEELKAGQTVPNGKIDVPALLLKPVSVTKDNVDEILIDSGYIKKDELN